MTFKAARREVNYQSEIPEIVGESGATFRRSYIFSALFSSRKKAEKDLRTLFRVDSKRLQNMMN